MKVDVLFLILVGFVGFIALRMRPGLASAAVGNGMMVMPAAPQDVSGDDTWGTPYYLRYNTAPANYYSTLLPVPANYTYALGVPSQPYTQKAVTN